MNIFTVDVEDWFHILDSPAVPDINEWGSMPLRAERGVDNLLQLLSDSGNKGTFFWLGWMAERMPKLVERCKAEGHEIASHGYGHVLAYKVGEVKFKEDIVRAKKILEDITGQRVKGFRAPGFGIDERSKWAFSVIKETGYEYDASIFPGNHGHGGMQSSPVRPYMIPTDHGNLQEIPVSAIEMFNKRINLFGGGYLRITPYPLIRLGIEELKKKKLPLIIYVHPRELDPDHPRLALSPIRKFKCYTNLTSTAPKLKALLNSYEFHKMDELVEYIDSSNGWK